MPTSVATCPVGICGGGIDSCSLLREAGIVDPGPRDEEFVAAGVGLQEATGVSLASPGLNGDGATRSDHAPVGSLISMGKSADAASSVGGDVVPALAGRVLGHSEARTVAQVKANAAEAKTTA